MTSEQRTLWGFTEFRRTLEASRKVGDLGRWLDEVSGPGWKWYVKELSNNDTGANGSKQGGIYVPSDVVFELFPSFVAQKPENTTAVIHTSVDSHGTERDLNMKWWGSAKRKNPEGHLTNWKKGPDPVLDHESTGSVVVVAFHQVPGKDADSARAWLCASPEEADEVFLRVGAVEPGRPLLWNPSQQTVSSSGGDSACRFSESEMPDSWLHTFPPAEEIVRSSVKRLGSARALSPDDRLMKRRDCEYSLFQSLEQVIYTPRLREGFGTVEIFFQFAHSAANRRKSRAGASLGLHTGIIFGEETLPFSYDKVSEGRSRPDFILPSAEAYHSAKNAGKLMILAAKTTVKDRWRQVLVEADKVRTKHLLTLQEGVSLKQFEEMKKQNVVLVVPRSLHKKYPKQIRHELLTLAQFIALARAKCT